MAKEKEVEAKIASIPKFDEPEIEYVPIKEGESGVAFLDINPMFMTCIGRDEAQCLKDEKAIGKLPNMNMAKNYSAKLVEKLALLRYYPNSGKKTNWRVIRTHNPIINPEIDMHFLLDFHVKGFCYINGDKVKKITIT